MFGFGQQDYSELDNRGLQRKLEMFCGNTRVNTTLEGVGFLYHYPWGKMVEASELGAATDIQVDFTNSIF